MKLPSPTTLIATCRLRLFDQYGGRQCWHCVDRSSVFSDRHSVAGLIAGQTAIFRCYVAGDPQPCVEWSSGDWRPVMSVDRVRQYVDDDGSDVMELDGVSAADARQYTVTASNELGSCSATATLVIDINKTDTISLPTPLQDM